MIEDALNQERRDLMGAMPRSFPLVQAVTQKLELIDTFAIIMLVNMYAPSISDAIFAARAQLRSTNFRS